MSNTYNTESLVSVAHADQFTHDFSCRQVTWGEFVKLLHGEAARERNADMIGRKNLCSSPPSSTPRATTNAWRQTRLFVGMALHNATGGSNDVMDIWSS